MKVLIVTPNYPMGTETVIGGVEGVCLYLTQELNEVPGIEIEVLVASAGFRPSLIGDRFLIGGVKVHVLRGLRGVPRFVKTVFELPLAVRRKVEEISPDIVHVQGAELLAQKIRGETVLTIHGIGEADTLFRVGRLRWLRSFLFGLVARRARRCARNVIVISPYVRQFLEIRKNQTVWAVENPVAESFFQVPRAPLDGRIIVAATIVPRKNIKGLIRAFALLSADGFRYELRIAGDGMDSGYGKECRAEAEALGVAERVTFLGSLSVAQMQEELSCASCLALTSFQETAPLVISEAMAAGVPVAASNICGIPYMVQDGVTGRLFRPDDVDDIAEKLRTLLRNDDLVAFGAEAKVQATERFHPRNVVAKTCDVYKEILQKTE